MCPFCKRIAHGEYDGIRKSYFSDFSVVDFEPLRPVTPGHRLFVPTTHVLPLSYSEAVAPAFDAAQKWGSDQDDHFNLILNQGAFASQTVDHLHVHYVPRRAGDGLMLPWTNQHKES